MKIDRHHGVQIEQSAVSATVFNLGRIRVLVLTASA
jgi:hypothetical protein